jgi:hypothetical protein
MSFGIANFFIKEKDEEEEQKKSFVTIGMYVICLVTFFKISELL